MIRFRKEKKGDYSSVHDLNKAAFGRVAEADLMKDLRQENGSVLSLVAAEKGEIIGHILITSVTVEKGDRSHSAIALSPMAVLPEYQGYGIGSTLVLEGLKTCRDKGHRLVFVLGHPEYYPRFGFCPAADHDFHCEFEAPDEAFMVIDLNSGTPRQDGGLVRYHPLFRAFSD